MNQHQKISAKGGRNRAINLKKKLGDDGFRELMRKVALSKRKNLSTGKLKDA